MFLPAHSQWFNIVGSLNNRELSCSCSPGLKFQIFFWRAVASLSDIWDRPIVHENWANVGTMQKKIFQSFQPFSDMKSQTPMTVCKAEMINEVGQFCDS